MMQNSISKIKWSSLNPSMVKDSLGIPADAKWVLPQLLAFIGNKIKLARNDTGKFSFKESIATIRGQIGSLEFSDGTAVTPTDLKGMFIFLNHRPRGEVIARSLKQGEGEGLRYSSGVPLILSAFKEYRDINYEDWDWSEAEALNSVFLDKHFHVIASLKQAGWRNPWSDEELIEITEVAKIIKSTGKVRTLDSLTKFNKVDIISVDTFASDTKVEWLLPMLCQTWCFQPHKVHKYSITQIEDLDARATPLRGDIDIVATTVAKSTDTYDEVFGL